MQITIVSALRRIAGKDAAREDEKSRKRLEKVKLEFVREMGKHPLLKRIGPDKIWISLQKHIRKEYLRRKSAGDDTEQRLQEIRLEFLESVGKSLSLTDLEAEKLWNSIQPDIRQEMRRRPGEWRSE